MTPNHPDIAQDVVLVEHYANASGGEVSQAMLRVLHAYRAAAESAERLRAFIKSWRHFACQDISTCRQTDEHVTTVFCRLAGQRLASLTPTAPKPEMCGKPCPACSKPCSKPIGHSIGPCTCSTHARLCDKLITVKSSAGDYEVECGNPEPCREHDTGPWTGEKLRHAIVDALNCASDVLPVSEQIEQAYNTVADAINVSQNAALAEVREAGAKVVEGFERGYFVRSTSRDNSPTWALELAPYIQALSSLAALKPTEPA